MAITTADLSKVYDEFLTKGLVRLTQLQKDTEMEDEQLAIAASNVIVGAMQNSVSALETIKRVELLELQKNTEIKKALDIASSTAVRDAQSAQDILNKASEKARTDEQTTLMSKQVDTEIKKTLDIVSSTAVRDAQSAQDLLNKAAQKLLIDKQVLKLVKDTSFVAQQTVELTRSVEFNNKIKSLNSYGNMIGTMGAGGLVISSDMWRAFFDMIRGLNANVTANPTSTSVVKA